MNLNNFFTNCCKNTTKYQLKKIAFYLIFLIIVPNVLISCSKNTAEEENSPIKKKKNWEEDPTKRARKAADENPLFGKNKNSENTYQFGTSNVLWRATLSSLENIPLANVDYAGGMIITDWYSVGNDSKQQIKIVVRFLSTELSPSSVKVSGHLKTCNTIAACNTSLTSDDLNQKLKIKIIENARKISIEDNNKKNKMN